MESVFCVLVVCQISGHLEVLRIIALNINDMNVQIHEGLKGVEVYARSSLPTMHISDHLLRIIKRPLCVIEVL